MVDVSWIDWSPADTPTGLIPQGSYVASVVDTQERTTRAGTGRYLEVTFQIMEGAYAGRKVYARLHLWHESEYVRKRAKAELKAMCHAVGKSHIKDTTELIGVPLRVLLGTRRRTDTGDLVNDIKRYDRMPLSTKGSET